MSGGIVLGIHAQGCPTGHDCTQNSSFSQCFVCTAYVSLCMMQLNSCSASNNIRISFV